MEGVMMRGKKSMATAVRNSDGDIVVESKRLTPVENKNVFYRIPVIRGVLNFVSMLYNGTQTLLRSSEVYGEEIEPSKFDKWLSEKFHIDIMKVVIWFSVILGVAVAVGLFVFLPQLIAHNNACILDTVNKPAPHGVQPNRGKPILFAEAGILTV